MENIISVILIAISTFAVTNIDDLLILSIYFTNPDYKKSNVVAGQYLGVITLIGISLLGLLLGKVLEPAWVGLLGLVPIFIGVKDIMKFFKTTKVVEKSNPISVKSKIQFLNVMLVTIANGGDNIGVYAPLFASSSIDLVIIFIVVFVLMIALWCLLAFYFVKHSLIKTAFAKFGHTILPFFLILLGIWILFESKSFKLLY